MGATRPSLDYLLMSSQMSLESIELARLNRAANLRKEMQQVLEEWIDVEVDARLARSILEWRRAGNPAAKTTLERHSPSEARQLEASFLSSQAEMPAAVEPLGVPEAPPLDRAASGPNAPTAGRAGFRAGGFPASRVRLLRANGGGEPLPANADREIRAIGPLAPRRPSLAKPAQIALLHAEHRTYGDCKVLRESPAVWNDDGAEKRPLCRSLSAIALARRQTIAACEPRPAAPARRLLGCAAAFGRRVAAAS